MKSLNSAATAVFAGLMIVTGMQGEAAEINADGAEIFLPAAAIDTARNAAVGIVRDDSDYLPVQAQARGIPPGENKESMPGIRGSGTHIGNGYILTAYHVVEQRDKDNLKQTIIPREIRIRSQNLDDLPAQLVGANEYTDIAVYRADPAKAEKYLGSARLAERDMQRGEKIFTVGYPLGWGPTEAFGYVGSNDIFLPTVESRLVHLDLSACNGNSGGGIFNAKGEIVGMAHAVIGGNKEGDGVCSKIFFAIPGDVLNDMAKSLIAGKSPKFPKVGAGLTVSKLGDSWRVAVSGVSGPAEKAGLQTGDVFLSINGMPIKDGKKLKNYLVEKTKPGDTVSLEIMRGNEKKTLSLTLGGS
ncbi:MAG: serine protease [Proteobacteria bacterium]|nr:serine protease [Pseudomonadota bacterium]